MSSEKTRPSWAEWGPLQLNTLMPELTSTDSSSDTDSDPDMQDEKMFVSSVEQDESSSEQLSDRSDVSLLRGRLNMLGVHSRSQPIPAPTTEYYIDDGWLTGQKRISYVAWVLNNE